MISRRTLLQSAATTLAIGILPSGPARRLWAMRPSDLLPDPDEAHLRELALLAVEVAQAAGANFADVRVAAVREVTVRSQYFRRTGSGPAMQPPGVELLAGYGVRALVDGAWGFASGFELSPEAVRRAGQAAVDLARRNRPRHRRTLELAPAPQVPQGRWVTPIEQDPFAVPFGEQGDVQLAALAAAAAVPDVTLAGGRFRWQRFDQVFASSEGTLLVQRLHRAVPSLGLIAMQGDAAHTQAVANISSLRSGGYGYEVVAGADLTSEFRAAAERAAAESRALRPPRPVEVGRYDLVLSAGMVGTLLGDTLGQALDLERALGYRANREGTSFAAPPAELLGTYQIGSPLLTIHGDRSRPHGWSTVGWDDEGVAPGTYTVVQDGVLVDYHTSRQTAPTLAAWYRARGEPVRSHGCAVGGAQLFPEVGVPNLALEPGPGDTTEADLIADTKRGFYVRGHDLGLPDQQLLNGQYSTSYANVWEIRNGKLGERISDLGFQFLTPQFWKSVDALGGAASAQSRSWYHDPTGSQIRSDFRLDRSTMSVVPIRARQVNVLNLGRTQ